MDEEKNVVTAEATQEMAQDGARSQTPTSEPTTTTTDAMDKVLSELTTLRAELQTLKDQQKRKFDSIEQRLRNQMSKKFAAIDTVAQDEGWSAEEVRSRKERAAQRILMSLAEEEETPMNIPALPTGEPTMPAPNVPSVPSMLPQSLDEAKRGIEAALADYGLTTADMDISPFLRQVSSEDEVAALDKQFRQAVAKAMQAKLQRSQTPTKQEQNARKLAETLETMGGIGGMSEQQGAPETGRANNKASLDVDWESILRRKMR